MQKKYIVRLSDEERAELNQVVKRLNGQVKRLSERKYC